MTPPPFSESRAAQDPVRECTKYDPDVMFPDDRNVEAVAAAKAVCAACEAFAECRRDVLENGCMPYGVWAGLSERERRAPLTAHRSSMRTQQRNKKRVEAEAEGQYELAFGGAA